MNIWIKNARIIDKESEFDGKVLDIFIHKGIIELKKNDSLKYKEISGEDLCISPGWFDMRANFADPGYEHKEGIQNGIKAAIQGGFTGVAFVPNTKPVVQGKDTIQYLIKSNSNPLIKLYPIAAVSTDNKGEELTEMMDLHYAGAIAFSDGNVPLLHSGLLTRALQYVQPFGGLIIQYADDRKISQFGQMNEGVVSTYMGLKGIPNLAEEVIIARDLSLLRYTGGKIHFTKISTKESVGLIANAKKEGLNVTCDVAIPNLIFTEDELKTYDTNYKVCPPLRTKEDLKALWKGLENDTIDAIVTDHEPQDEESKKLEFDQADFGMIQLETAFSAFISCGYESKLNLIVNKMTYGPKSILGLDLNTISEGSEANLTLFSSKSTWNYNLHSKISKSANSPFLETQMKGKVIGVIKGENQHFNAF
ncbi:MAG: dihydroorotase [Bacteroidota bacterium]|nr:dihydroorotase [Bacteroidota bacterium]